MSKCSLVTCICGFEKMWWDYSLVVDRACEQCGRKMRVQECNNHFGGMIINNRIRVRF